MKDKVNPLGKLTLPIEITSLGSASHRNSLPFHPHQPFSTPSVAFLYADDTESDHTRQRQLVLSCEDII